MSRFYGAKARGVVNESESAPRDVVVGHDGIDQTVMKSAADS
jgi:hypothetical protein